ncbi:MAG TPA: hypothetical protein DCS23_00520 [Candidatus Yonathbacteria bacterium]|nr:hypothetical protein [Candidatus Yonathbacteria bacterium]
MAQTEKNFVLKPPVTEKRFLIFFLWTSLVPLVLLFIAGYYTTINLLKKETFAKQTALVEQKHGEMKLFIEKIQTNTAAWSTDGKIRELAQKINDGACEKAKTPSTCPVALELSEYLTKYKLPLLHAVGIIDILNVDGVIVASSDTSRIGSNESKEQIPFSEAKLLPFGQATFFPELVSEADEFEGRIMVHLTAPIASTDNARLVGVLLAHTENKELNIIVAENRGLTTESYMVNKDKLMVTPSRFVSDAVLKQEVNTPPVNECLQHGMPFQGLYEDYRGVEVFGASVCDNNFFGTHIVETDKSEVLIEINRLRNTASAILIVVLILILVYAYLSGADIIRGARHIFPNTISSGVALGIVISIMIIATIGISYVFTKSIEQFIVEKRADIISSLVSQQANRHINGSADNAFLVWDAPETKKKFQDFSDEILHSFSSVSAFQLHTPDGVLVWSTLQGEVLGTSPEVDEVAETIATGKIVRSSASKKTVSELGDNALIGMYVPILGINGDIVGVAEAYINTSDVVVFTRKIQTTLWMGSFIALLSIFLLLRYVFRKQDAKIIAQSEELSGVIEESPIGIYTVAKDGTVETFNPAMTHEIGIISASEIIGKNIFELDYFRNSGLDVSIREGLQGNAFRKEVEIPPSSDTAKKTYHFYYGVPLKDADGEIDSLLLMAEDITERKELESEVREYTKGLEEKVGERTKDIEEARAKAEALLASLGEGMIATDKDGKLIALNPVAEKMLDLKSEAVIGKLAVDVIEAIDENNIDIPNEKRVLNIALRGESATLNTMCYKKKDAGYFPVSVTWTPVMLGGVVAGAVGIFRDITKEKELEKARGDLLSLASHQLRTPLSGTKWLIETLRKGIHGPLTAPQIEYLDELYKINERMTGLVHDMLGVLRLEGGDTKTKKESTSTKNLIGTVFETMRGVAESKQIAIRAPENTDYTINTDPLLLRNILESLVGNAINYSESGREVTLHVEQKPLWVIFSIKDSGIGIPKGEQRQIFERFYRASNAKTFDTRGSGLGLYIASMLAKKIGAHLSFESEEGKGSTFYVHVPYPQTGVL